MTRANSDRQNSCRVSTYTAQLLQQEAQLSQRDHTMLQVIEYFANSLTVSRNDIPE